MALEVAEALMEPAAGRFSPEEGLIVEFSSAMGSYTGPGLLGLAVYEDRETL